MSRVIAVIVTFNSSEMELKEQFDALAPQVDGIIYVDNDSEKLHFPASRGVSVILNKKNLGLGRAQNIGVAKAKKWGATHVLLMDQDSVPTENFLKYLLEPFKKSDNKIAAVGANIINAYAPTDATYGIIINGGKIKKVPLLKTYTDVSYVIASGCLISMSAFNKVGGMDESLFIDGVDFEWCMRAKNKGYHILQSREAKLIHELGNGSTDKVLSHSPIREYYIVRNSIRMSRMNHIPFFFRLRRFVMSLLRVLSCLRPSRIKYFQSGLMGLKDGIIS